MTAVAVAQEHVFVEYVELVDVEFVDEARDFQCVRCDKVLFQHYISNCGHAFCANCKRVVDDGSHRWKCPRCQEYIKNIDVQDEELHQNLYELRVHCPNKKFGCDFIDQLKNIQDHLKDCGNNRDNNLPKLLVEDRNAKTNFAQMFEINQKFKNLNEEMSQMSEKIIELESKDKADEKTLEIKLNDMKSIVEGARSDMIVETTRISIEFDKMKNKARNGNESAELKDRFKYFHELIDFKDDKLNKAIANLKTELKNEFRANLKDLSLTFESKIDETREMLSKEIEINFKKIENLQMSLSEQAIQQSQIEKDVTKNDKKLNEFFAKTDVLFKAWDNKETKAESNRKFVHLVQLIKQNEEKVIENHKIIENEIENAIKTKHEESVSMVNESLNGMQNQLTQFQNIIENQLKNIKEPIGPLNENTDYKLLKEVASLKSEINFKFEELASKDNLTNEKINNLKENLENQQTKTSSKIDEIAAEINQINEKSDKMETEFVNVKAEVEGQLKKQIISKQEIESLFKANEDAIKTEHELCMGVVNESLNGMQNQLKEHKKEIENQLKDVEKSIGPLIASCEQLHDLESRMMKEVTSTKGENDSEVEEFASKEMLDSIENLINEKITNLNQDFKNQQTTYSYEIVNVKAEIEDQLKKQSVDVEDLGKKIMNEIEQSNSTVNRKLYEQTSQLNKLKEIELSLKSIQQKISQLKTSNFQIKPQMNMFNLCEKNMSFQPDFIWKIKDIKEMFEQENIEVKSEVFAWNGYPVKAQAILQLKQDDKVYVSLHLEENNAGKAFGIKPIPNVTYVLRDQSDNTESKHRSQSKVYLFTSTFKCSLDYERAIANKFWFTNTLYNVGNSVLIDIYVEPPYMAQQVYSYDGTVNWSINNYKKRKQMEKEELVWSQESPYFYTGPRGYRVNVNMWLNGWGKYEGKGLSLGISFLTGEFDAELTENFPHQTTVTLLNRNDPERNIIKRVNENIEGKKKDYFIDMCSNEEIEGLLENDTLFCNIKTMKITRPMKPIKPFKFMVNS